MYNWTLHAQNDSLPRNLYMMYKTIFISSLKIKKIYYYYTSVHVYFVKYVHVHNI